MRTRVFLTIDTETSMGGAWNDSSLLPVPVTLPVFCQDRAGKFYGIPLIVEEMARFGMQATYFCEMLCARVLGEEGLREVTDYLLSHGQDVQLHLHPTYRFFEEHRTGGQRRTVDFMSALSREEQTALLEQACDTFQRLTGTRPVAFRAGNYAADRVTLEVLGAAGIVIDSSYNPSFPQYGSFPKDPPPPNVATRIGQVWEYPVTAARPGIPEAVWKSAEISAISASEMRTILDTAHRQGASSVVVVFHPFSSVKQKGLRFAEFRPDRIVIGRLRELIRFLGMNPDRFEVSTFRQEAERIREGLVPNGNPSTAQLGFFASATRKLVQAVNRVYWV